MFWDNLIDTLLNLSAFAFIGVLLWLYLKKEPERARTPKKRSRKRR
ncbi:MAG: hypothetical protein ACE5NW_06305 [Acidiferrobacterales bacterium]